MIKLFWIVLFITSQAISQVIPNDKLLHMGGSYVISSSVASIVYNKTENKKKALVYGLTTSLIVGVAKEAWDIKHGDPDIKDIAADFFGASLGIITIRITL